MGSSSSKPTNNDALLLCKERIKYIKQAVDARYALSAAHLSYLQSLGSLGAALRRFSEAELLVESSLSTSEVDKSPSHSSYASPSPSRFPGHVASPSLTGSPLSPRLSNMSYMRTTGTNATTITIDSLTTHFVEDDPLTFPLPPPPPPLPDIDSSWDFFDANDAVSSVRVKNGECDQSLSFSRISGLRQLRETEVVPLIEEEMVKSCEKEIGLEGVNEESRAKLLQKTAPSEQCGSKMEISKRQRELCTETEDASEFITHRAKDFLSSMRDIEHRFLRAAEAGNEVSRMLETNKIRLGISSVMIGKPPASQFLSTLNQICCKGETSLRHGGSAQNVTKVITWNRTISSLSSSSKHQIASVVKDDAGDSSSEFIEEYSMISGSHSSTLDRLCAWERKLYDEIKASEYIRKAYDQKCSQLRHQFARDVGARLIDKTRAVVKDLHSGVRVAIQSVDSISKRIEKMRDEELQPQLIELIQALIRMSKVMLECHHSQFITISLAYLVKSSTAFGEPFRQALVNLRNELGYYSQSFSNWVNAHKSYIEALNAWLQKCVLQPQERKKGKKAIFPPRQALSPPIFVLCNDWLVGLKSLPSEELCDSIKAVMSILHDSFEQTLEENAAVKVSDEPENNGVENKEDPNCTRYSNLDNLQTGLTRMFDRLAKFSEASLKVHEDVKQGNEIARIAYTNAAEFR